METDDSSHQRAHHSTDKTEQGPQAKLNRDRGKSVQLCLANLEAQLHKKDTH
jgi:hypothetical protein